MSESDVGFGPFNVIAAFASEHECAVAVDALAAEGVPQPAIAVHRPDRGSTGEEVAELEADMQDELVGSWGVLSDPQAKRAFAAAVTLGVTGVVLGIVVGLGWAYLFASGLSRLARILIVAGVTGLAGATIGLVDGGGGLDPRGSGESETDDEAEVAERDVLVTVHVGDPVLAERAATVLRQLGAERVHLIDAHGIPLPPQAQHPRPADPEGWWWKRAGYG